MTTTHETQLTARQKAIADAAFDFLVQDVQEVDTLEVREEMIEALAGKGVDPAPTSDEINAVRRLVLPEATSAVEFEAQRGYQAGDLVRIKTTGAVRRIEADYGPRVFPRLSLVAEITLYGYDEVDPVTDGVDPPLAVFADLVETIDGTSGCVRDASGDPGPVGAPERGDPGAV